jgi:FKBP-type peptidyl-prolyl cis-trans isomerase FkpA
MWKTLLFLVLAAVILYVGYTYVPSPTDTASETVITNADIQDMTIEDKKIGTGATAEAGKMVSVHYVGTLTNGTKFDSSRDRGTPFTFKLGAGQVIEGWDKGVSGMKVGGIRKLTIPPELGYGSQANGPIPANSTLVFEVELLDVK